MWLKPLIVRGRVRFATKRDAMTVTSRSLAASSSALRNRSSIASLTPSSPPFADLNTTRAHPCALPRW